MVDNGGHVCVVVMGDIGRSPRMMYHALSFADQHCSVDLIGYNSSKPPDSILGHSRINVRRVLPAPKCLDRFMPLKSLSFAVKLFWQSLTLCLTMLLSILRKRADVILLQNPPGLPGMYICWLIAKLRGSILIIDWHNYTHSIMACSMGENSAIVRLAKKLEFWIARRRGIEHFCVTKAMKTDLEARGVPPHKITVLYDRPGPQFSADVSLEEKAGFWSKLTENDPTAAKFGEPDGGTRVFTGGATPSLRPDRPAVLVSSTSWTADEDFGILLEALRLYEDQAVKDPALPPVIAMVTGKGPLKDHYLHEVELSNFEKVQLITPWLPAEDYPLAIASADLGVCLHTSTSGLDLPMKIVDMFGCGVPVLGV